MGPTPRPPERRGYRNPTARRGTSDPCSTRSHGRGVDADRRAGSQGGTGTCPKHFPLGCVDVAAHAELPDDPGSHVGGSDPGPNIADELVREVVDRPRFDTVRICIFRVERGSVNEVDAIRRLSLRTRSGSPPTFFVITSTIVSPPSDANRAISSRASSYDSSLALSLIASWFRLTCR